MTLLAWALALWGIWMIIMTIRNHNTRSMPSLAERIIVAALVAVSFGRALVAAGSAMTAAENPIENGPLAHAEGNLKENAMIWLFGYIGTIFCANWLIVTFGAVPVGFGLMAPAGVYAAGLALTLRDMTQEALGRGVTVAAIAAGALLSYAVSPQFAAASGLAFLVSEVCDFAVYTPLRDRNHWLLGVTLSNTVGLLVDSALFLSLAFGSLDFLAGQVVGKAWVTAFTVGILWAWKRGHIDLAKRRGVA